MVITESDTITGILHHQKIQKNTISEEIYKS